MIQNKVKASELAILNIYTEGLTDIFDRPFEVNLLKSDAFKKELSREVVSCLKNFNLNEFNIGQIEHILLPKKEFYDFRRCALIQPLDTIKYTTLVLLIATIIEKKRIKVEEGRVFSYRFNPENGYLFDKNYNFTSFRKKVSDKSRDPNVNILVSCDISNFYDRLNLHRLESILITLNSTEDDYPKIVKLINQTLLFWANRDSYGIPVGGNASRILAEAALIEVDNYLVSKNIDFIRYVDDYRLFAPDAMVANKWLSMLINKLSQEGLFINTGKTNFKDVSIKEELQEEDQKVVNMENDELENKKIEDSDEKEDDEKNNRPMIISGYSGIIPRKFRIPNETETEEIKSNVNIDELVEKLKSSQMFEINDFKLLIKSIILFERYEYFEGIVQTLRKLPQLTPYFIDVLIKYKGKIKSASVKKISSEFSKWLKDELPDYLIIEIAKLLGCNEYKNYKLLFEYFSNLKRNSNSYIARKLLDSLESGLDRIMILEIKSFYSRSTAWEKRQITNMIKNSKLFEDEKNPILKNIGMETRDLFEKEILSPKKNK